jgi:hypothetical protein
VSEQIRSKILFLVLLLLLGLLGSLQVVLELVPELGRLLGVLVHLLWPGAGGGRGLRPLAALPRLLARRLGGRLLGLHSLLGASFFVLK